MHLVQAPNWNRHIILHAVSLKYRGYTTNHNAFYHSLSVSSLFCRLQFMTSHHDPTPHHQHKGPFTVQTSAVIALANKKVYSKLSFTGMLNHWNIEIINILCGSTLED